MNLLEITIFLNEHSKNYNIGNLQNIRRELKGLTRLPSKNIFDWRTTFDSYAFHVGGRTEFQFNIGYESKLNLFRFGLAFSLESNQTLPDVSLLFPKIDRFNKYFQNNPSKFYEFSLWYHTKDVRSQNLAVKIIDDSYKMNNTFIFIGKYFEKDLESITEDDCYEILSTMDELLDVYIFVENEKAKIKLNNFSGNFIFQPGLRDSKKEYFVNQLAVKRKVNSTHKEIQENIYKQFSKSFGKDNVGTENSSGFGAFIDIVVKNKNEIIFYEVKTSNSLLNCIREALPQLLEYAYYPNRNISSKLIIVSDNKVTKDVSDYLHKLRTDFKLPVYYQSYDPHLKILEDNIY